MINVWHKLCLCEKRMKFSNVLAVMLLLMFASCGVDGILSILLGDNVSHNNNNNTNDNSSHSDSYYNHSDHYHSIAKEGFFFFAYDTNIVRKDSPHTANRYDYYARRSRLRDHSNNNNNNNNNNNSEAIGIKKKPAPSSVGSLETFFVDFRDIMGGICDEILHSPSIQRLLYNKDPASLL